MRAFFYSSLGYYAAGLCKFSPLPLAYAIVCKKFSGDRHKEIFKAQREVWTQPAFTGEKSSVFECSMNFQLSLGSLCWNLTQIQHFLCHAEAFSLIWEYNNMALHSIVPNNNLFMLLSHFRWQKNTAYATWHWDIVSKDIRVKSYSYWDGCKISTHC